MTDLADLTQVAVGTFFGGLTLRIAAAMVSDALLSRRLGGR